MTATEPVFPVESFRDAATHLRRPFTPHAVKFKVQATWPKQNPANGMIVGYIDARLAIERLNLIVPHLWSDYYEQRGQSLVCSLTVDGLTRSDVGDGVGKAQYSDALKRAAVKFGVGVSLYAIPSLTLKLGHGLREQAGKLLLTSEGEREARTRYARWLESHGKAAFGEPLDHGDTENAQGDAEVEDAPTPPEPEFQAFELPDDVLERLTQAIKEAGMPSDWLRLQLVAVGAKNVPEGKIMRSTLRSLSLSQAMELSEVCARAVKDRVTA